MNDYAAHTQRRDAWERLSWLWVALYYITLLATMGLALSVTRNARAQFLLLLLGSGMGIWHAGLMWYWKRQRKDAQRPFHITLLILPGILLWFILVQLTPTFYLMLAGIFPWIYIFLPIRWAALISLLITLLTVGTQMSQANNHFSWDSPALWIYLALSGIGVLMGVWINAIIIQSVSRRKLIEQLQATQAELAAAGRREGMLQERERLAHDIHDTLAQGLISIIMHLEVADQSLPTDPAVSADWPTLRHHLQQARQAARDNLEQARQVVQDLRPDLLTGHTLPEAIQRVVSHWTAQTHIPATATITGPEIPLHPEISVTLLRAVQEALANVQKHAQATDVQVTLSYMEDVVHLDVQDNGLGLNGRSPFPFPGGFGLTAMRQRVIQLGGTVEIESEPGTGTTITVSIPVRRKM